MSLTGSPQGWGAFALQHSVSVLGAALILVRSPCSLVLVRHTLRLTVF